MGIIELMITFAVLGFMTWIWSNVTRALSEMVMEAIA